MKTLELNNHSISNFKNSVDGLNSRMEGQERISEMEARTIKIAQSELQKEKQPKKILNRACETLTKDQLFMSLESWKKTKRT